MPPQSSCVGLVTTSETQSGIDRKIGCLPPEILSHIFVIGSHDSDAEDGEDGDGEDEDEDDLSHTAHFATLCSHVCRLWRNVAIDTPQLWSSLDFEEILPLEKSKEWIVRSKEAPLTIQVDLSRDDGDDGDDGDDPGNGISEREDFISREWMRSQAIIAIILPHVHRWRTFELVADYYELVWNWLADFMQLNSAPILEHLGFFCHEEWVDEDLFHPQDLREPFSLFPGGTPTLRSVCLWGVHFQWEMTTFLKGLECLQLAWHTKDVRLTCKQFVRVLRQSPKLKVLTLEGSAPIPGIWPQERILLPSLSTLIITYIDVSDAISVIDHIDFPALKTLTVDLEAESVLPLIQTVCQGNKPRFESVKHLKLTSFQCWPDHGISLLRTMPNVTSMTLNFRYLPHHFCLSLRDCGLCPNLDTLKLSGINSKNLKRLIKARQESPTPIKRLYLDRDDDFAIGTLNWLKRKVESVQLYEASDEEDEEDDAEDEDSEGDDQGGGGGGGDENDSEGSVEG